MPTVTFAFFPAVCDKDIHGGVKLSPAKGLRCGSHCCLHCSEEEKTNASWSLREEHIGNASLRYRESCWQCSRSLIPRCVLGEKVAGVLCGRPYHVDAAALLSPFWKFSKYSKDLNSW